MKNLLLFSILICSYVSSRATAPITGPSSVCQGSTITLSDATAGGAWGTSSAAIATVSSGGVVTGVASGTVTISYTAGASSATITVTVNPIPTLTSLTAPAAICDSQIFNYTPMSAVAGTIFTWSRAAIPGIVQPAASGTGNPIEALADTTPLPITVVYTYTLTAGGCAHVQPVTVTVNPTPILTSPLYFSPRCDTIPFIYLATSSTPGATFAWDRPVKTGVSPATNFGTTSSINELLTDTNDLSDTVTYYIRLGINGCTNLYTQTVTVIIDTNCSRAGIAGVSENDGLHIYPNPSAGNVTISGINNAGNIALYNTLGEIVHSEKITAGKDVIMDLSYLPAGIYLVRLSAPEGVFTSKIIKQ